MGTPKDLLIFIIKMNICKATIQEDKNRGNKCCKNTINEHCY
jgi:hypothetical protein